MCVLGFCIKIESSRTRRGGEYTKALFKCDSILARRLGVSVTLGISVHCLAVFCLCHLHRFPSGHRQKISFLTQMEMTKLQIGTHTQLEFSQFMKLTHAQQAALRG